MSGLDSLQVAGLAFVGIIVVGTILVALNDWEIPQRAVKGALNWLSRKSHK